MIAVAGKVTMCCRKKRLRFHAVRSGSTAYRIRWYSGRTDITAAVVNGTYQSPRLAYDGSHVIRAVVKRPKGTPAGAKVVVR